MNPTNTKTRDNALIVLILMLATLGQFAIDVYLPSLPSMRRDLGSTNLEMQLTLTVYLISLAISQMIYGPLSDRYGRKSVLLTGIGLFLLVTPIAFFTHSGKMILLVRFLQGAGAGACNVTARAILRDYFSGKKFLRMSSYMSIAWAMTPMIAPAFGGYIEEHLHWRANFIVMFIYLGLAFFVIARYLPETHTNREQSQISSRKIISNYISLLRNRYFVCCSLLAMLTYMGTIAFNTASPFLIETQLGYSPVIYGYIMLAVASSYLFGTMINSQLTYRYTSDQLIGFGIVVYLLAALAMVGYSYAGIFNIYVVTLPVAGMIFAMGFIYPNAAANGFQAIDSNFGSASAVMGAISLSGCALSSGLIAQLHEVHSLPLALTLLLLGVCCLWTFNRATAVARLNVTVAKTKRVSAISQ